MLTTPVVDEDGGGGAGQPEFDRGCRTAATTSLLKQAMSGWKTSCGAVLNLQRDQSLAEQQDGEAGKVTGPDRRRR